MLHATRCARLADVLSGVALSKEIRRRVAVGCQLLSRPPCLAVVLVGDRPDARRYVKHKRRAAEECGITFRLLELPDTVSQQQLHRELVAVNSDHTVDGVLLQLPLPPHLRARPALFHIHPGKDVDGLHPLNAGNLFLRDSSPLADAFAGKSQGATHKRTLSMMDESLVVATGEGAFNTIARHSHERKYFIPCTALAVRSLLVSYLSRADSFFSVSGVSEPARSLHAVIVNTSMVVGVPTMALLQKERGFVVSMCNRNTPLETIKNLTRTADVLVTAYGEANVFDAEYVKKGAIVIDVAINEAPRDVPQSDVSGSGNLGKVCRKLCGDVDFASVRHVARAISPVPGGVGPLTVAHLMQNVLKAAHMRHDTRFYYNNVYASFVKMYGVTHPDLGSSTTSSPSPHRRKPSFATTAWAGAAAAVSAAGVGDATVMARGAAADAPGRNDEDDEEGEELEDFTDNDNFDC